MIPSVALNREVLLKIGEQLRVLDIVSDAVPDQFAALLARLEISHKLQAPIDLPRR